MHSTLKHISNSVSNHPHVNPLIGSPSRAIPLGWRDASLTDGCMGSSNDRVSASIPKWKSVTSDVPQRAMLGWALFYLFSSVMASGIKGTLQWVRGWHQVEWCSCCIRGRWCHPEGDLVLDSFEEWAHVNFMELTRSCFWVGAIPNLCEQVAQRRCGCSFIGSVQDQVGAELDWTMLEYPF